MSMPMLTPAYSSPLMSSIARVVLPATLLAISGCASRGATSSDSDEAIESTDWTPCDEPASSGATCATFAVPHRWQEGASAGTLPYFVRRFGPLHPRAHV